MNEQVTTNASGQPTYVTPIVSSSVDKSGSLSNVQTDPTKAVSLDSLQPQTPLQVPTATPRPDSLAPAVASATQTSKSLQDYIKELTPPATETSNQYNALADQISQLLPGLGGRGEAQLSAETAAGLPEQKKRLADINAQLLTKVAEVTKSDTAYEQLIANLENPNNAQQLGIPMSAIIGQQAQVRKAQLAEHNSKAADLGLLQAYALGLQGQVQAAQEGVNRAIDLKYQDRESELNLKMQQLSILEGKLNKEEAITKQALERKYAEEQQKLEEEKAKAKDNINLAFQGNVQTQFVNKNGEFFDARTGQGFSDPASFFKAAGVKSFEEAYKRGLVTDVTPQRIADIEYVQQLRAKYSDAGISLGDSAATAEQKVAKNSRIYADQVRGPVGKGGGTTGFASVNILDPNTDAGVKAIIASRPGDGGWGNAYDAVAKKYGKNVADRYNAVFDYVFRQGESVDAAFNDAKLGSTSQASNPAVSQALNVILGSTKLTKEQKATLTNSIQNGQDPFSVIKNQAKDILGAQGTQLSKYESAKEQLDAIKSQLKTYYDNGGKTNVFTGGYEKTINKLGEVNDPKLVDIATQIAASLQIYRNAVSGTAYSEQEGQDIASIFPGINKTKGLNDAILQGRTKAFETTIDSLYRQALGDVYDTLKTSNSGEIRVREKSSGRTGTIPADEFDPNLHERI